MEIWKQIPKYIRYEASTHGRIRHIKHQKIRKTRTDSNGYLRVNVANSISDKQDAVKVHRLIAYTFLDVIENSVVDHIDRNRENNRLDNLRVTTVRQNNSNRLEATKPRIARIIKLYEQGLSVDEIYAAIY